MEEKERETDEAGETVSRSETDKAGGTVNESKTGKAGWTSNESKAVQAGESVNGDDAEGGNAGFRYDAFISYRHAPLDLYVAQTLQRRLETFKVPKLADKETKELGKKSIRRIFRDKDELPLAGNLSEPIMEALSSSENLIVICSPRILESLWCRREIETFISLRGMDHVYAVLIEGEPEEAFPEPLRTIKKEVEGEDGSVTIVEVPVEPLAADVRGKSKAEVNKKIKQEMLRLVAPMLGCSYDDLRQRHKMRRLKRMLVTAAAAAGALFLFGTFSAWQAFRIKLQSDHIAEQSEEIMAQSEEIAEQSKEIMAQSGEIQAQAQSLYAFQSRSLSETALQLYESGDRRRALLVALEGLPEDLANPDRPIVAQTEAALAEILQVYANGEAHRPFALFEHDAQTTVMSVSPSGTRLASVDSMGQLYCWDIREGTLLVKGQESVETTYEISPVFLDEERVLYVTEDSIVCADSSNLDRRYTIPDMKVIALAVSPDLTRFAVAQNSYQVAVYDAADGSLIACYEDEGQAETIGWNLTFSEDGKRLLFEGAYGDGSAYRIIREDDAARAISIDAESAEVLAEYQVPHRYISTIYSDPDGVTYLIAIGSSMASPESMEIGQSLTCYEPDGSIRWEIDDRQSKGGPLRLFRDMVVYTSGDEVCMVSKKDGSTVQELHYPADVLRLGVDAEERMIMATLDDGTMRFDVMTERGVVTRTYLEPDSKWMLDVLNARDTLVLQQRASNCIYLHRLAYGVNGQETANTGHIYYYSEADKEGRLFLYDYENYLVYDMRSDEVLYQYDAGEQDETVKGLIVLDDSFLVITKDMVRIYDSATGELTGSAAVSVYNWAFNGGALYYNGMEGCLCKLELPSCQVTEVAQDKNLSKLLVSGDGRFAIEYDTYDFDFCIDIGSGEGYELPTACKMMAADQEGETYLAVDQNTMQLMHVRFGEQEPLSQMSAQTAFIKSIGFSPDGFCFFICYTDNRLEIYDTGSFTLVQSYRELNAVSEWRDLGGRRTLLCGSDDSYILDGDNNILYRIPGCMAVSVELNKVYSASGSTLYSYPLYDLERLVEEARDVLGDTAVLTPEERRLYYIE